MFVCTTVTRCDSCGVEREGRDGIYPLCSCGQGGGHPAKTQWVDGCPYMADIPRVESQVIDAYLWSGTGPADPVHIVSSVFCGEERASGAWDWEYFLYCGQAPSQFFFGPRPPRLRPLCNECLTGYASRRKHNPVNPGMLKAPLGMTRILRRNSVIGLHFWVADGADRQQVIADVNRFNAQREHSIDDVYLAYDDHGTCVAGDNVP